MPKSGTREPPTESPAPELTHSHRLSGLRECYRGERCFIMGSGPSLNQMDLERLRHEYVWGVNKCYLLFDRISWRPAFYTAVDRRVVPDMARQIERLVRTLLRTRFFFPARFLEEGVLRPAANIYWYREAPLKESGLPFRMFSLRASDWVAEVRTVTIAALQLAVYLGFNPIYLIGCDTSYAVQPTVRHEEDHPDRLVSTDNDDANHFDPRYFGKGSRWHQPHVERMLFHYAQARRACEAVGVKVYNATAGGKLEVFPRVDYTGLF